MASIADQCVSLARNKYSLNAISHDSAIGLVKQVLLRGVDVKEVRRLSNVFTAILTKSALFIIVSLAFICICFASNIGYLFT